MESVNFFKMKEECKLSCVRTTSWSIVVKEDLNTLILYILEYFTRFSFFTHPKSHIALDTVR